VLMCAEKISEELEEEIEPRSELSADHVFTVPLDNANQLVDKTLNDIPLSPSDRFFDVIFEKFDIDEMCDPDTILPKFDEEKFMNKHLREDPRLMMANYGLIGGSSDEVKFGELLPNRNQESNSKEAPS